jgi:outer membrane murein-binding lipoprotein Lpp
MKVGKPLVIAVLVFVVGATISASLAFADDSSNPIVAIWQAISELQTKTNSLQSQIDEIRTERGIAAPEAPGTVSEPSVAFKVSGGEAGQSLI